MIKLRDYQSLIVEAIRDAIKKKCKYICVESPTGSGKTIIALAIAKMTMTKSNRFLFTTHRIQLNNQTVDKFKKELGDDKVSIAQGDTEGFDTSKPIQIGTLQTLINTKLHNFNVVIIDEAHWGKKSKMVKHIYNTNPNAIIISLTATPIDRQGYLLNGFDTHIRVVTIKDLINQKYLVPFSVYIADFKLPSLDNLKIVNYDYEKRQLSKRINQKYILKNSVQEWIKICNNMPTIVFCIDIEHSESVKNEFKAFGINCESYHSKLSKDELNTRYNDFVNGKITVLTNVDMLTTGNDIPTIKCIMFCRPMKVRRLFVQMVGRGARLNGNTYEESCKKNKPECIILDCAGVIKELGMPDTVINYKLKPVFTAKIDAELNIDNISELVREKQLKKMPKKQYAYLKKVSSDLDIYKDIVYFDEDDLKEDIKKFLDKTDLFYYRQNSGVAKYGNRFVTYTSKSGLPDIIWIYNSIYIGIELKIHKIRTQTKSTGKFYYKYPHLTDKQKITFPEMINNHILLFFAFSVRDMFDIIDFVKKHIIFENDKLILNKNIYKLYSNQVEYYKLFKLPFYA